MFYRNLTALSAFALVVLSAPVIAEVKIQTRPDPEVEQMKPVGSLIVERLAVNMIEATAASEDISVGQLKILSTMALVRMKDKKSIKYCASEYACVFDDDGDGKFDRTIRYFDTPEAKLDPPVPYEIKEVPDLSLGYGSQEIRYMGATEGSLQLNYREYSKGLGRQNVNEDLTVPLGKSFPQSVAVKNLKLTILSIDGMGMCYRIEK
ncbi:hypothetical protein [Rhizorhabdus histidinilytica]|uniref:hypothetical protein n=1 Tax=Rhizorhabdus histidinilytica TaxID=439228 RepID=UPI0032204B82